MKQTILVWDWPTRIFHWMFALSFAGAYLTSESERYADLHYALGYLFGGLLVFRVLWGVFGTCYARFGSFLFTPGQVISYLRSLFRPVPQHYIGHNPVGGLAIVLLLGLGVLITISGLGLVWEWGGYDAEELFEEVHEAMADLMLLVVFVHIAGVIISSVLHRENLIMSMLTGRKQADSAAVVVRSHVLLGGLLLLLSAGFLIFYLGN